MTYLHSFVRLLPNASRARVLAAAVMALTTLPAIAAVDEKAVADAIALRNQGEFEKATRALQNVIEQTTPPLEAAERRTVEFEIERIRRIREDYQLTREKLLEQMKARVRDFRDEELDAFEREGKLDVQIIDGHKRYVNSSASNLLFRQTGLRARRIKPTRDTMYRKLYEQMLRVKEASKRTDLTVLLPQDFLVTYTLTVHKNAVSSGSVLKAWLPFVRAYPHHTDIHLLQTAPAGASPTIAPPEYPHRTVYLEQKAVQDHAAKFQVQFLYRSWARATRVIPEAVQAYNKSAPEYAYYSGENKPHVDFSNEELKRLSSEIAGSETNPYKIARSIYEWIANNTIYQYAREYSTIENLAHYTASRRAGDCGQHGMLFIALCRMNGIPARWTTGWESFNSRGVNMHDWCEFYVEPYGWIPADPDMAVNLLHHVDDELTTGQARELADWLFGNMDHYRLTVNSDFSAPLLPAKSDFRSETVDFQRGEVESEGKNVYFDKWDYSMKIAPVTVEAAQALAAQFVPPPVKLPDLPAAQPSPAFTTTGTVTTDTPSTTTPVLALESTTTAVESAKITPDAASGPPPSPAAK